MENVRIYFSPFGIISVTVLVFAGGIIGPIILDIMSIQAFERGKTAAIYFLIAFTIIPISVIPVCIICVRCFRAFLSGEPALELTDDYYIDNVENIKLSWSDISRIWILENKNYFLKVALVDNSIIYKKVKSPIWRCVFRMNNWSGGILSINLSLLKGKKDEILKLITDYQLKVIRQKAQINQ